MGSAARVNADSSPRCGVVFPFVPFLITSPSAAEAARGAAASHRSGRSARRAGPREARFCARRRSPKTVTCHGLHVVEPVYHQASLRGRLRSWRASRQGQRCDTSDWPLFVLLCRAADVQRSGPDREVGLTRQCNGGLCVRLYSFWFTIFITRRRWASSPGRSSPTPASLVKNRSRHTS